MRCQHITSFYKLTAFLTWGGLFFSPGRRGAWISAQETKLVFCPQTQPNPDTDQMRRNQIYFSGVIFKNKPAPLLPMCLLWWNMDGVIRIASCSPWVGPSHHMLHTQHNVQRLLPCREIHRRCLFYTLFRCYRAAPSQWWGCGNRPPRSSAWQISNPANAAFVRPWSQSTLPSCSSLHLSGSNVTHILL